MLHRKFILTLYIFAALCWIGITPRPAQATISFVGAATQFRNNGESGGVVIPEDAQQGDLIIVFAAHNAGQITSNLAGWTTLRGGLNSDVEHILYRFVGVLPGDPPADFTFSSVGNTRYALLIFRGVSTTAPINGFSNGATVTAASASFPQFVTATNGCFIVRSSYAAVTGFDNPAISHSCGTVGAGYFTAADRILVSYQAQTLAGMIPSCSVVASTTASLQPTTLALAPAPDVPPPPPVTHRRRRAPVVIQ